ncbi:nitrate regulatory protein [Caenimonas aquaedulcis]|uniref:Nitrate- and nitrite sensing domain-containing protein n=1 Tax=Caenimonas aquaedulcis TaxID=2793270 RepID=A0A931H0T8_9BURK|nr:nitrate regulatory protein [Caenimonas aquaedulcis]MBG9386485.1 nitrate- and nitrite sensing domain-containing protein [Caenimonas aquaedulcis]
MKSGLSYLLAARQCEIDELERLARTSELVGVIGRFNHALQRERGISNIYLASRGERFGDMRVQQMAQCDALQRETIESFERLGADGQRVQNGARLFHRVAVVLQALDGLPELRSRVATQAMTPRGATEAYARLVAGLLAVVFEAADSAGDPEISRALVAMFNYMQGKEFAGQERAFGSATFASGRIDAPGQREWRHLIEQQQQCFQVFADFADAQAVAAEHASHDDRTLAQLERLRRVGWALADGPAESGAVLVWYDCCTQRLDAMRAIEDLLAANLRRLCERKIAEARDALRNQKAVMDGLHRQAGAQDASGLARFGPQLERSVFDLVQEQSRRLQAMSDELDTVRGALNERKVVERAKGLLMAHRQLSEEEAYKSLRQMAMNQKRRLVDVAEAVLAMADMLPGRPR